MEYSNNIFDFYKSIEEHNPIKEGKLIIVLYNMITDMISNKKAHPILTEIFIRGRNLSSSLMLITQPYFPELKLHLSSS